MKCLTTFLVSEMYGVFENDIINSNDIALYASGCVGGEGKGGCQENVDSINKHTYNSSESMFNR
jgi:hypothetical protein